MTPRAVVVLGDALLDRDVLGTVERLCPDAPAPVVDVDAESPRPGGAALAAAMVAASGRRAVLVTALADDPPAAELRDLLAAAGVEVVDLGTAGPTAQKVRVRSAGQSLLRLDRGGRRSPPRRWHAAADDALADAGAVLVADYGRGLADDARVRGAVAALPRRVPVVWDPHPRGPAPVAGVHLVTPNAGEAAALVPDRDGDGLADVTARARALAERWQATGVAVTMGARGALLVEGGGPPVVVPPPGVATGDPCGAGDRFASAAAVALAGGAVLSDAVAEAVRAASAFVAAGGATSWTAGHGAAPRSAGAGTGSRPAPKSLHAVAGEPTGPDAVALARAVRASGGTVVATGGCFDLLHAGHVATLRAARALGDCLVVCLNSDESVRRLKGPDRPLQPAADRARVLAALDCVDAVHVFDDDTPVPALGRLRPHVFAKGGDYALGDLPEAPALQRWGGQAVVLPYLPERSTTRLVEEVLRRAR
jgi:rfaE bifunctional protein nucleotidyltransferase chain/domain/rfaE bifunctional protein kinase chain/domain